MSTQEYLGAPPESFFVKAAPHRAKYDQLREVVALRDMVGRLDQMIDKLTLGTDLLKRSKEA